KSPGRDPDTTRRMMRDRPDVLHRLLAKLAESTAAYLSYQIDCGVEAVQLFESAADLLSPEAYRTFALPYQREVFERIGDRVPRILFAREFADLEAMVASGADCLSVGTCVDLREARDRFGNRVALQGNVNNRLLLDGPGERIEEAVRACIEATGGYGHILNLNHGLLPETPPEHVSRFIEAARRVSVADRQPVGG
ncbi:MAG: uroporphyrinogen decarboxylase, partial [Planctomycetota bacterium]